ncbi:type II toxin-antitoxin system HicB family antitoxin [Lapidilactobacillus achengensis]|uniref:Type II toxin-antitoxin system HicB family antitoxin n=1 Tax=Lapidilactobacillus achengensis TaxID=2486000 RepID=A0ABW1UMK1_9LACO|nr:type II toxin-antitoxin system HicB family antitoxin [Lapidilactobacillus achengensis]
MKYLYIATLTKNKSNQYEVEFPDLAPNAATFGDNLPKAMSMAKDALEGYLLVAEDYHVKLPKPSSENVTSVLPGQLIMPVEVDTTIARERAANKLVKKTLTIPKYLNDLGNENGINFSATLTAALEKKLGIRSQPLGSAGGTNQNVPPLDRNNSQVIDK